MKTRKQGSTRISLSIVMFVIASFMPNVWSISLVMFVAAYSLISGIVWLRREKRETSIEQ
ncbi:hypothetical protein [Paenibacillus motobuensis]|uniref:CDP-diacylglycerol--serine O-phosphatidyltransferase n=1 Tax=Paenibacillus motobuensis TaxID=295324 RepID=A0ABP3IHM5_9BACL